MSRDTISPITMNAKLCFPTQFIYSGFKIKRVEESRQWRGRRMLFFFPHKCIKNTPTHGTILAEHLINTSRGAQTPKRQESSPYKHVIWEKEERTKKRRGSEIALMWKLSSYQVWAQGTDLSWVENTLGPSHNGIK